MHRLRRHLAALAAFTTLFCVLAPRAEAQTTRTRAIILSFEGWNAEAARAAIESGLNAAYDMISEQQAVDTAMQIGVDPSTPEGLGAVVARLHIQLVIGGSVSGTGRRAQTTIWVTDTQGNQLATRTAGSPSGRGFEGELTTAALQACGEAVVQLPSHSAPGPGPGPRPEPDPETGAVVDTTPPPDEPPPEPAYDPDYDIENDGRVFIAIAIADQAADIALKRSDAGPLRHQRAHLGHPQIDGDMLAEQRRIDPQIDVLGHPV